MAGGCSLIVVAVVVGEVWLASGIRIEGSGSVVGMVVRDAMSRCWSVPVSWSWLVVLC